ncbi:related to Vault poly [Fusarium torulosum]|uniref:Related to Vault poly n=1 Tax=Fusarium torulosum TaxID=33205 RepID=A0AAE8M3J4_9HYPO|nr:related to Vault poly [Fusarium torulosum]
MSLFGNPWHRGVASTNCGCYILVNNTPKYLPQVQVNAHTTILATTSRTNLTQTFINSTTNAIDELRYVFPLYDGVSVVAFTCTVGSRVIKGVVKERQKAQQVYNEAKAKGQTAGLFKQSLEAADTFTTTIGNVPAGEKVQVDITYLGELKHDAQVDGLRFTIPTQIVPRYGNVESVGVSNVIQKQGISFTIDVEMPDGSSIKSVQSPSHPLSVDIGTTSTTKSQDPSLQRASATLQQGTDHLEQDFIVQVVATKIGEPSAILETHPTIPNQRAIMTTLVPKFKLPTEKPEIVFVCDRSGSMAGQIPNLKAALEIFLKSLPVGVKFNICSFGSSFSFLWERSQTYSQETLDKAVQHVQTFESNYGGTDVYQPFEATFQKRYRDMNLEVFLLTDGETWDQDSLFKLINTEVAQSEGTARVFSLGIGAGVSTSLIEGIARAGNGFSQTVGDNEKMDKMVVRMLRGALSPHITDYSLEIKYEKVDSSTDDDEFELVEKVADGLKIDTTETSTTEESEAPKKPISLFDNSADDDDDTNMKDAPATDNKYDHLPAVSVPRYLQTPSRIPALFPFSRTTVYVLLSDATPAQQPKSVILKGTSRHGPLELEIPITTTAEKDSVIHCLAARKEVKELEEGRGWLAHAKDTSGKLLKEKHDGHFSDMVEREAVRLGVKYQVGGKWCSFVAVADNEDAQEVEQPQEAITAESRNVVTPGRSFARTGISFGGAFSLQSMPASSTNPFSASGSSAAVFGNSRAMNTGGGLFGAAPEGSFSTSGGLFGSAHPPPPAAPVGSANTGGGLFGAAPEGSFSTSGGLFGSAHPPPPAAPVGSASTGGGLFGFAPKGSSNTGGGLFGAAPGGSSGAGGGLFGSAHVPPPMAGNPEPPIAQAAALAPPAAEVDEKLLAQYRSEMNEAAAMPLVDFGDDEGGDLCDVGRSVAEQNEESESDEDMGFALMDDGPPAPQVPYQAPTPARKKISELSPLQALTTLQTFSGSWTWSADLERVLGLSAETVSKVELPAAVRDHAEKDSILATACAVLFFKKKLMDEKDTWEMLVEKAEGWLEDSIGEDGISELDSMLEKLF